jgi:small conductance mechanosensitive channel
MGPLVLLLAIFAVMGGIAGKGVLENFSAGLSLQISRAFVVGDRVELKGATGWVEAIDSHAVVLKTPDGRRVHVPNRDVLDSVFVNYTDTQLRRSEVTFSVAYGQDLRAVRSVALDAAASVELTADDPEPTAFIKELGNGVDFMLRFFHDDEDRFEARHQVQEALLNGFEDADINLSTPEIAIVQPAREEDRPHLHVVE